MSAAKIDTARETAPDPKNNILISFRRVSPMHVASHITSERLTVETALSAIRHLAIVVAAEDFPSDCACPECDARKALARHIAGLFKVYLGEGAPPARAH